MLGDGRKRLEFTAIRLLMLAALAIPTSFAQAAAVSEPSSIAGEARPDRARRLT